MPQWALFTHNPESRQPPITSFAAINYSPYRPISVIQTRNFFVSRKEFKPRLVAQAVACCRFVLRLLKDTNHALEQRRIPHLPIQAPLNISPPVPPRPLRLCVLCVSISLVRQQPFPPVRIIPHPQLGLRAKPALGFIRGQPFPVPIRGTISFNMRPNYLPTTGRMLPMMPNSNRPFVAFCSISSYSQTGKPQIC